MAHLTFCVTDRMPTIKVTKPAVSKKNHPEDLNVVRNVKDEPAVLQTSSGLPVLKVVPNATPNALNTNNLGTANSAFMSFILAKTPRKISANSRSSSSRYGSATKLLSFTQSPSVSPNKLRFYESENASSSESLLKTINSRDILVDPNNSYVTGFDDFPSVNNNSAASFFKSGADDEEMPPPDDLFFRVDPEKVDERCKLIERRTDKLTKKVYFVAPLEWQAIQYLASERQRKSFIALRDSYVKNILFGTINEQNDQADNEKQCDLKSVGSAGTSVASDIDYNLICTLKNASSKNEVNYALAVMDAIMDKHYKYFTAPLDKMFDINIYVTNGDEFSVKELKDNSYHPSYANNKACVSGTIDSFPINQRGWSFIRILLALRALNVPTDDDKFQFFYENAEARIMTVEQKRSIVDPDNTAKRLRKKIPISNTNTIVEETVNDASIKKLMLYKHYMGMYIQSRQHDGKTSFAEITDLYSSAKYFENESYRSIGAIKHIVSNSVPPLLFLYDSVYDNMGFALENVSIDPYPCPLQDPSVKDRIPRVAKYLERVCSAILEIRSQFADESSDWSSWMIEQMTKEKYEITFHDAISSSRDGDMTDRIIRVKEECGKLNALRKAVAVVNPKVISNFASMLVDGTNINTNTTNKMIAVTAADWAILIVNKFMHDFLPLDPLLVSLQTCSMRQQQSKLSKQSKQSGGNKNKKISSKRTARRA